MVETVAGSHPETWLITQNSVRRTDTKEGRSWQSKNDVLGLVTEDKSCTTSNKCIENAARRSPNCIRKTKNKIQQRTIFNMAVKILSPCNVACGSGMTRHWIRQVALPCNVARGSGMTWHWIRYVALPCNVTPGSGMTCHWICPNVGRIWIVLPVSILTISPYHSASFCKILCKSDYPWKKHDVMSIFKMADLRHHGL